MHKGPTLKDRFILYPAIGAAFLFVCYFVALNAWGYKFSIEDGKIVRKETGIIIIATKPGSADVYLDGKKQKKNTPAFSFISLTIKNVPVGSHNLRIVKDGYEDWEGTRQVEPGLVSWANYLILVPQKREALNYNFPGAVVQSVQSPDKSKIVYLVEDSILNLRTVWIINPQNKEKEKIKEEPIVLGEKLAISSTTIDGNRLLFVRSSEVATKYFVSETKLGGLEWNISDLFGTNIGSLKFSGESNLELVSLAGRNIRYIEYESKKMSAIITTDVVGYYPESSGLYVIKESAGNQGLFKVNKSGTENNIVKSVPASDSYQFEYLDKSGGYLLLPAKTNEVVHYYKDKNNKAASKVLSTKAIWFSISPLEENVSILSENTLSTYNFEQDKTYVTLTNKPVLSMGWFNDEENIIYSDGAKISLVNFDGFYDKFLFEAANKTAVYATPGSANVYFQTLNNEKNDSAVYSFNF